MTLSIGQILKGSVASYHVAHVLKAPTVFQARVVPFENSNSNRPAQLAVLKHFPDGLNKIQYNRELHNYTLDSIAQSPYIRSMLDRIGHDETSAREGNIEPQCMVFEWMDTDLWQLPSAPFRSGSILPRTVAQSILEALAVLDAEGGVHTDVNPNNVFLSGAEGPSPVVKLGDLGNLVPAGPMGKVRYQGVTIRAPEVWMDVPITPKADVWSLGVTLAHWLAGTTLFGPADKIVEDLTEHWCIAKLMRLVGPIGRPDASKTDIIDEFALAEYFESDTFVHPQTGMKERYIKVGTIRQELEKVPGPIDVECIDFIESLLVPDPTRRPSAREALQHPWLTGASGYGSDWSVD